MSRKSFEALGASRPVVQALAEGGIRDAFPVQSLVLPDALAGRDVLVKSPTGSGKTIAFAIPLVERIEAGGPRPTPPVRAPPLRARPRGAPRGGGGGEGGGGARRPPAGAPPLGGAAVYGGAGIEPQI